MLPIKKADFENTDTERENWDNFGKRTEEHDIQLIDDGETKKKSSKFTTV